MYRFLLALTLISLCGTITGATSDDPSSEPLRLGIAAFTWQGYRTREAAAGARTTIEAQLLRSRDIRLVDRQHLGTLLEEGSFQQSGVTPAETAVELGGLDNVQMLLFGEVVRIDAKNLSLSLKLVDVASGHILRIDEARLPNQGTGRQRIARRLGARLAAIAPGLLPVPMIRIPGGTLRMGRDEGPPEEGPAHRVDIDSFDIDRTEVTRAAFSIWAEARRKDYPAGTDPRHPATMVSWEDAAAYCTSLAKRLPTEAEWELAARGLEGRVYPWGQVPPTAALARYGTSAPVDVGALPGGASPEGVLQLAGNVSEWVADWWDPRAYSMPVVPNPSGPDQGEYRVIRGGSYADPPQALIATSRSFHNPDRGAETIGFRCARSPQP